MLQPPALATAEEEKELLRPMAARLIWWQPAAQALRRPERVIAQVMDIGDFDTLQRGDPVFYVEDVGDTGPIATKVRMRAAQPS